VPDKAPQAVENERGQVSDKMYKKLEDVSSSVGIRQFYRLMASHYQLFKERAVWTRMSLLNQFSVLEAREIVK